MQLELFQKTENEIIRDEITKIRESSENVRRGIFTRFNELSKLFLEQQKEIEELKEKLKVN